MRVLSLFSGIGGFDLGLERAGMKTVAFCEIEPYCVAVLNKHWPGVKVYGDVTTLTADTLRRDGIAVDVICGGFPCQDVSVAGKRAGIDGARSGLWREYFRLVRELRPQYVIVENVAGLLDGGLGRVLGDLAEIGYDAQWQCIPASAVGALHHRERIWITAYPDTNSVRPQGVRPTSCGAWSKQQLEGLVQDTLRTAIPSGKSGGVSDGVTGRSHRLKALGNSIVPQVAYLIGNAIMSAGGEG